MNPITRYVMTVLVCEPRSDVRWLVSLNRCCRALSGTDQRPWTPAPLRRLLRGHLVRHVRWFGGPAPEQPHRRDHIAALLKLDLLISALLGST
jgi:hypothetical protein